MARVFITGSTDGLGRRAAEMLRESGHEPILHARSRERAAAVAGLGPVVVGDLASAAETRDVAEQVNALGRMDAIIHNAGVYLQPGREPTPEGHAATLAINVLAPWLLTCLIARPGRLIYLSSGLHRGGEGPLDDIDWTRRRWDAARAYGESKLHLVALAFGLARRWPETLCHAVDPGWARTRMGGAGAPVDIDTGAATQAWLAVSDDPAARTSGRYWRDRQQQAPAASAADPAFQDALIAKLAELTGVALPSGGGEAAHA